MTAAADSPEEALTKHLQDAGLQTRDPVRWALIETLLVRAGSTRGRVREQLLQRAHHHAQQALANVGRVDNPGSATVALSPAASALGGLLEVLDQASAGSTVLKAVEGLREVWSQRDMESRVSLAIETLPDDCGPLNSRTLVTRSLQSMAELSPAYLRRFVNHVDTLLWLQAAAARGSRPEPADTARKVPKPRPRGQR